MKKLFLVLAFMMVTSLSYAFDQSVHIFDYRTGGPVTSATKEIGAILTLKNIGDLPNVKDNDPLIIHVLSAWGFNVSQSSFNLQNEAGISTFAIATPHYKGSVSTLIGVYAVPKNYPVSTSALFSKGIVANFDLSLETTYKGTVIQTFNVASNYSSVNQQ